MYESLVCYTTDIGAVTQRWGEVHYVTTKRKAANGSLAEEIPSLLTRPVKKKKKKRPAPAG